MIYIAHSEVPDHRVRVDASDPLWIHAQCSCGEDFSRRKWLKVGEHLVEEIDKHLAIFAPIEAPYDDWEFLPKSGRDREHAR